LEDEVICKYGVPKYIMINNGTKWMKEFAETWQNYDITHQFTTLTWLKCNGMVERLIKTIKQGLMVMATTNIQSWNLLLPMIFFGYQCGIQTNTKYSPFMVFTRCAPKLTIDNTLNRLHDVFYEFVSPKVMAKHMVQKM
jgi:hypothetical protein